MKVEPVCPVITVGVLRTPEVNSLELEYDQT